jgi:hypothetical protein
LGALLKGWGVGFLPHALSTFSYQLIDGRHELFLTSYFGIGHSFNLHSVAFFGIWTKGV